MTPDLCPPTPPVVPATADTALVSRLAVRTAQRQTDLIDSQNPNYRRIVAEYDRRVAEAFQDQARLREEMRAFGGYLRERSVLPEHLVLCVHEALKGLPLERDLFTPGGLGLEIVKWAIEGYYDTR